MAVANQCHRQLDENVGAVLNVVEGADRSFRSEISLALYDITGSNMQCTG